MNARRLVVLVVAAGAIVACGGDDDAAGEDPTPTTTTAAVPAPASTAVGGADGVDPGDPCTLLSAEEASALVGVEFRAGISQAFEAGIACIYIMSDTFVGVQVFSEPGTAEVLAANAPVIAPDAVALDGVGEAAFISEEEATIGVLQDGVIFSVTLAVAGQPASRELVLDAADLVLARLR